MAAYALRAVVSAMPEEGVVLDECARVLLEESAYLHEGAEGMFRSFKDCAINRELSRHPQFEQDPDFATRVDLYADVLPSYVPFLDRFVATRVSTLQIPEVPMVSVTSRTRPKKVRLVLCRHGEYEGQVLSKMAGMSLALRRTLFLFAAVQQS